MYEMWKSKQIHEDARKSAGEKFSSKSLGGSQPKRQEAGGLKDEREELKEKSIGGF